MTIRLDDEVFRWAKIWAARHDTSVSRIVSELLGERMRAEETYGQAMSQFAARNRLGHRFAAPRPFREELHDRKLLRG